MINLSYIFLCSCLIGVSYAASVNFIDKCKADDNACLIKSTQKAIQFVAPGIPSLGVASLDPLSVNTVAFEEGGLKLSFRDTIVTEASKCKVLNVERKSESLLLNIECPIQLTGKYTLSGALLGIPIEGDGPYLIKTKKINLEVKTALTTVDGSDGQKHWSVGKPETTFDFKSKATVELENLYNGDTEKSKPILDIFDQNWKSIVTSLGKPVVEETVNEIVRQVQHFFEAVPASELEL